jgi:hypothetical protein
MTQENEEVVQDEVIDDEVLEEVDALMEDFGDEEESEESEEASDEENIEEKQGEVVDEKDNAENADNTDNAETEQESPEEELQAEEVIDGTTQANNSLEQYKIFNQHATREFKRRFGTDYDDLDDTHRDAMGDIKAELKEVVKAANLQQQMELKTQQIMQSTGDAKGFQKYLIEDVYNNMSVKRYNSMREKNQKGDFSENLKVIEEAKNAFLANKKIKSLPKGNSGAIKESVASKKSTPPKTISSGVGNAISRKSAPSDVFTLADMGYEDE